MSKEKRDVTASFHYPPTSVMFIAYKHFGVFLFWGIFFFFAVISQGRGTGGLRMMEECPSSPIYVFIQSTNVSITY